MCLENKCQRIIPASGKAEQNSEERKGDYSLMKFPFFCKKYYFFCVRLRLHLLAYIVNHLFTCMLTYSR